MKKEIVIKDGDKLIRREYTVRAPDHLEAQKKFPLRIQRDRTKYTRKSKHKLRGY